MDVNSYVLSAGVEAVFQRPGRFFMLTETNGPVTVQFIKNRSRSGEIARDVEQGYISLPGDWRDLNDRFDGFVLTSATNQTIKCGTSERASEFNKLVLGSGSKVQTQGNDTATYGAVSIGVAATQIVAAVAGRSSVLITPVDGDIYFGYDNLVTTANGFPVKLGESLEVKGTMALFGIRAGGANVDVRFLSEVP